MMTIKVYEVNRDGVTREIRPQSAVVPLEQPEATHQYPACECPECKDADR